MRRDLEHVQDMVDAAQLALSYVRDVTLESFRHDTLCQDAVIRRIGSSAKRPGAFRTRPGRPIRKCPGR